MTLSEPVQRRIMRHLMIGHPLPWRLEFDWGVEVTDANDALVITCMNVDEANEIIALANWLTVGDRASGQEFARLLVEPA